MLRLVVLGKTEAAAKEAAEWCSMGEKVGSDFEKTYDIEGRSITLKAVPVWVGLKAPMPKAEGVIIVFKADTSFGDLEGLVNSFKNIPIKFILYDGAKSDLSSEAKWAAKGVEKKDSKSLAEVLIKANNELVQLIGKVFKAFDKDGSGFIDLGEIVSVGKELGTSFSPEEASKLITELDTNHDGKISMEEFVEWWKSGRQGKSKDMTSLISSWLEKHKIIQTAAGVIGKPATGVEKQISTSFGIHVNKVPAPGLMIDFSVMTKGPALTAEFQTFSSAVGMDPKTPFFGIAFGTSNPSKAKDELENLLLMMTMMLAGAIPQAEQVLGMTSQKFGVTTNKACLCICPSEAAKMLVEMVLAQAAPLVSQIGAEQLIQLTLAFATDLSKISLEDKPFYELLLEGIALTFKGSLSAPNSEKVKELYHSPAMAGVPKKLKKPLASLMMASSWACGLKGELDFEIDEELKGMINDMAAGTPFCAPVKDIKPMFAGQLKSMLEMVPIAQLAFNFFKDNVTSIEFFVHASDLAGIKLKFDLPGLGEIMKLD